VIGTSAACHDRVFVVHEIRKVVVHVHDDAVDVEIEGPVVLALADRVVEQIDPVLANSVKSGGIDSMRLPVKRRVPGVAAPLDAIEPDVTVTWAVSI
jgi:hypothetical protein